jgi:hypothetical protein
MTTQLFFIIISGFTKMSNKFQKERNYFLLSYKKGPIVKVHGIGPELIKAILILRLKKFILQRFLSADTGECHRRTSCRNRRVW